MRIDKFLNAVNITALRLVILTAFKNLSILIGLIIANLNAFLV